MLHRLIAFLRPRRPADPAMPDLRGYAGQYVALSNDGTQTRLLAVDRDPADCLTRAVAADPREPILLYIPPRHGNQNYAANAA